MLNVAGAPGAADAAWTATTAPFCTSSIVPERLWLAVHWTFTLTAPPSPVSLISSPGVAVPFTVRLRNSFWPLRDTTVLPAAMPSIQLRYVI